MHIIISSICVFLLAASLNSADQFICDTDSPCTDNIQCKDNQDCSVLCETHNSCRSASNITGPNNANLIVECRGIESCGAPNNDPMKARHIIGPHNGTLTVLCTGDWSCHFTRIYCPIFGDCNIDCRAGDHHSCSDFVVDSTNTIFGNLLLHSLFISDFGIVFCPGNDNDCTMYCGEHGCVSFSIHSQSDTRTLYIAASGIDALKSARVYCPRNGECLINAFGNSSYMLTDTRIYAINHFNDVSLICNISNTSNCYDTLNPPQIVCTSDYDVICNIELVSGYDEWQCIDNDIRGLCNNNTLNGYYGSYFVCNRPYDCDNIHCNDNQDCYVLCNYNEGCRGEGNITGPNTGNLFIECTATESCGAAIGGGAKSIIGPQIGDLNILCTGPYSCHYTIIYCPISGLCDINCTGADTSCLDAVIKNSFNPTSHSTLYPTLYPTPYPTLPTSNPTLITISPTQPEAEVQTNDVTSYRDVDDKAIPGHKKANTVPTEAILGVSGAIFAIVVILYKKRKAILLLVELYLQRKLQKVIAQLSANDNNAASGTIVNDTVESQHNTVGTSVAQRSVVVSSNNRSDRGEDSDADESDSLWDQKNIAAETAGHWIYV